MQHLKMFRGKKAPLINEDCNRFVWRTRCNLVYKYSVRCLLFQHWFWIPSSVLSATVMYLTWMRSKGPEKHRIIFNEACKYQFIYQHFYLQVFPWSTMFLRYLHYILYHYRLQDLLNFFSDQKSPNIHWCCFIPWNYLMLPLCIWITPHQQNTAHLQHDKWAAQNVEKLAAAAGKFNKEAKMLQTPSHGKLNQWGQNWKTMMTFRQRNGKHLH